MVGCQSSTLAVLHEREELLDYLLEYGADVNILCSYDAYRDKKIPGYTPLMIALERGNILFAKKLMQYEPNVNNKIRTRFDQNVTALNILSHRIACKWEEKTINQAKELFKEILDKTDKENLDLTTVLETCRIDDIDLVRALVEKGADVTPQISDNPLKEALKNGNVEMVRYMLSKGAQLKKDKYETCLGYALLCSDSKKRLEMVAFLLEQGVDVNESTKFISERGASFESGLIRPIQKARSWLARAREKKEYGYLVNPADKELIKLMEENGAK